MEKKLNISFNTAEKKTYHISLTHPKENLSKDIITDVAQKIIDTGVFNNEKHTLVSLKKAAYVTREENEIK